MHISLHHKYKKTRLFLLVAIQVAIKVAERLTTQDLRRSRSFKKKPEMLGIEGEYPSGQPKGIF